MRKGDTVLLGGRGASARLARQDATFAPLYARFGPARVLDGGDPFAALTHAITNQQLSLAAGRTVYGRVEALCRGRVTPRRLAAASPRQLRSCGLSRPKTAYLGALAESVLSGELPLSRLGSLPDDDVVSVLTAHKGVGVWTAQMLLIFTLHRPDVLPTLDLGVQDAVRLVYGTRTRPTPARLERMAEAWRPYRSVASWYLWHERDRRLRGNGRRRAERSSGSARSTPGEIHKNPYQPRSAMGAGPRRAGSARA